MPHNRTTYFNAAELTERQRYPAFQESMSVIYDVSAPRFDNVGFRGTITSHLIDELMLVEVEANEQNFSRSRQKIASDGIDHFLIQTFRNGCTKRTDGQADTCGDSTNIVIYEASEPWESRTSDFANVTLVVPRRLLFDKLIVEGGHHGTLVSAENPVGPVLQEYLLNLSAMSKKLSDRELSKIVQPCVNLVAAALNHNTAQLSKYKLREEDLEARASSLQIRVRRYIDQHISNSELGVEQLLRAFKISRAHLYRVFPTDKGIATYIRERRLDLAYRGLTRPGARVNQVAYEHGFQSESTFRRAFKERFAISPSEVIQRERLSAQKREPISPAEGRLWEDWLMRL